MASVFTIGTTPRSLVPANSAMRITNNDSSATLYYGGSSVSSSSNDGSIPALGNVVVSGPRHVVSTADIKVLVEELTPPAVAALGQNARHWIGAPQRVNNGTSTTPTANRVQLGQIYIPNRCLLTGIRYDIGAVGGTDKAIAVLYDNNGVVQTYSDKTGTTVGTADTFQALPFAAGTFEVVFPGLFFIGIIMNGTTARIELNDASAGNLGAESVIGGTANSAADFAAAPVNVTAPTTVAAVPVAHTY